MKTDMTSTERHIATFYGLTDEEAVSLPDTHAEWIKCLDTYAQQKVDEFKEKLKVDIDAQIKWAQNSASDEGDQGYVSGLRYLRKLV